MKEIKGGLRVLLLTIVFVVGCSKNDGINVPLNSDANKFVWEGMRTFYYWESEIPDLAEGRFSTFDELHTYLNRYNSPEALFDHFMADQDRFSIIADDYEALDNLFKGISKSFGYEFRLVKVEASDKIFGYVEYVLDGSPADNAQLKRGDLFYAVNGNQLTEANFEELLFKSDNYTLSLGSYLSKTEGVEGNGETVTMASVELTENPVFLTKTFDVEGVKVGYLVYNQFIKNFHSELNEAFGKLKSDGVTEMVLDLRYNPGGSVTSAQAISSMLYSEGSPKNVFGEIFYNDLLTSAFSSDGFDFNLYFLDKLPIYESENDEPVRFEEINRLNLSRLFVLTSGGTASASELVIVGLRPYMPVTLIGTKTVGKNVGSITLYDSPDEGYTSRKNVNPNHRYAMQPIISQLANSVGFTDYIEGLSPDIELSELDFVEEIQPLGSREEPLLARALGVISGSGRLSSPPPTGLERFYDSKQNRPSIYQGLLEPIKIAEDLGL